MGSGHPLEKHGGCESCGFIISRFCLLIWRTNAYAYGQQMGISRQYMEQSAQKDAHVRNKNTRPNHGEPPLVQEGQVPYTEWEDNGPGEGEEVRLGGPQQIPKQIIVSVWGARHYEQGSDRKARICWAQGAGRASRRNPMTLQRMEVPGMMG